MSGYETNLLSVSNLGAVRRSGSARTGCGDARTAGQAGGRIEDLTAAQEALKKQMSELNRELESVREQLGKPNTSYARQEDLKRLARIDQRSGPQADGRRGEDPQLSC